MEERLKNQLEGLTKNIEVFIGLYKNQLDLLHDELGHSADEGILISSKRLAEGQEKLGEISSIITATVGELQEEIAERIRLLAQHHKYLTQYAPLEVQEREGE